MTFTVTIRRNVIPQVQASICDKSESSVRDSADYMAGYAANIAPVRTGAFRASFYRNGPQNESTYPERSSAARSLNPLAQIVPELKAAIVDPKLGQLRDQQTGRFTYPQSIVSSAVHYSLYLEEGTIHMAPRPTLRPAALATERQFIGDMKQVADGY
jgi:hypothetical protein